MKSSAHCLVFLLVISMYIYFYMIYIQHNYDLLGQIKKYLSRVLDKLLYEKETFMHVRNIVKYDLLC